MHLTHQAVASPTTSSINETRSYKQERSKNYIAIKVINTNDKIKKPPPSRIRRHKVSRNYITLNNTLREDLRTQQQITTNIITIIFNFFCSKIRTCGNDNNEGKEQQNYTTSDTRMPQTSAK